VNAYEDRSTLSIRDGDSSVEGHECVMRPGHDGPESGVGKIGSETPCNVERDTLFRNDVGANAPAVKAAVTRIDDHGGK